MGILKLISKEAEITTTTAASNETSDPSAEIKTFYTSKKSMGLLLRWAQARGKTQEGVEKKKMV